MSERAPYSRVYWSIRRDEKFRGIYSDDHHLAAWLRLLIAADATWPAPADLPANARKASIKALADCELIDLLGDGLFTVHGLDAERGRRRDAATSRPPSGPHLPPERGPHGTQMGPTREADGPSHTRTTRDSRDELHRDKVSRDEHTARDETLGTTDDETDLFAFIAQRGAFIRPDSGFGIRLLGLIDRRGIEVVMEKAKALDTEGTMSDRQWVFGLEKALEAIPSPPMEELLPSPEDPRRRRSLELAATARLEYFSVTGKWDPDLGPEPEWNPDWGDRPGVAA